MRTLAQLSSLTGRTALVVGGAGHIGRAAVDALSELGATVAVADLDGDAAAEVVGALPDEAAPGLAVAVDVADEDAVRALPGQVVARTGRLDIVVHTAAFTGDTDLPGWVSPFAEQSAASWRASMEVNLTSAFVLAQAAEPHLRAEGTGAVVLVGSIYGVGGPDLRLYEGTAMGSPAAYAAAKGGLLGLTRWLATVLAPHVRVNLCSPGGVERGQSPTFVERYRERTPMGRMATEEDLKGAIAYLSSDLSAYVTGQNLLVDGGWSAW